MKTEKRTEQIGLKITPTQKKAAEPIAAEGSANLSQIAYSLISIWIEACEGAGRYIAPHQLLPKTAYPTSDNEKEAALREITKEWLNNRSDEPLILKPNLDGSGVEARIGEN